MDPLQQRVNENKIYEEIVNIIVDFVHNEFGTDEAARLRVYARIAENFDGMVKAFRLPEHKDNSLLEFGEEPDE